MIRFLLRQCPAVLLGVALSSSVQSATPHINQAFASPVLARPPPGLTLISSTRLTDPFRTNGEWEFKILQDPHTQYADVPGNLYLCFSKSGMSSCFDSGFNIFVSSDIKFLTPALHKPALITVLGFVTGGDTNGRRTTIWVYDANLDKFERIFDDGVNHNLNEEIRVITTGPLAGDIVISQAPQRAPFRYHITVYRLMNLQYAQVLKYDGDSIYGDGNPMPVIDAEMAEIERRLHLWKQGDPLPTPARTSCHKLVIKNRVEWCENQ